jgi:hypothetical protein
LQTKKGGAGLLRFEFGQRATGNISKLRDNTMLLLSRFRWTTPFATLGVIMFVWGVWSYQPYHMAVGYLQTAHNQSARDYRIEISSKRYRPTELSVAIEGLPQGTFTLSNLKVNMESVGRTSVFLTVSPKLKRGLYPLVVVVHSNDGWIGRFNLQHFVE